jgi:tetratricopeptide (TPR) repeat protein
MLAILTEYKSLITIICIAVLLMIFRKELNKFIDWVISFKKISKTNEGYSVSTAHDSLGSQDTETPAKPRVSLVEQTQVAKSDSKEEKSDWFSPYLDKKYDKACDILRDMIEQEDDLQKKQEHRGTLGFILFQQNKTKGSEYFDEFLKSNNDSKSIYSWYALSLNASYDYEAAEKILHTGIVKTTENRELQDLLGTTLHEQSKDAEAVEILLEVIDQNPSWPKAYKTLAQTLSDIGLSDEAIHCCQVGMSFCPEDASLIEKFVELLPEEGLSGKKMLAYLRLSNLNPDNTSYLTLLGNQYLHLGLQDLALEAYRKANILASEKEAWILGNIGNILNNQKFFTYATEYLQKAVSIDPNSQYAHDRLGTALKSAEDERKNRDKITKSTELELEESKSLSEIMGRVSEKLSQPDA